MNCVGAGLALPDVRATARVAPTKKLCCPVIITSCNAVTINSLRLYTFAIEKIHELFGLNRS